jgi:hypothetical protein
LDGLRESIRRCPHGMLVSTACLRGPLTCAAHSHGAGVMLVLQPCSVDRRPSGSAHWVGPVTDQDDLDIVRAWLERGRWNGPDLPLRLHAMPHSAALAQRN